MNWLKRYFKWVLLLILVFVINHLSLLNSEMTHEEVFHEYIAAINGDSDYTLAHEFSTPDTLFGYFSYSSEYQPLKTQIDHLDSLVLFYIAKRDSVINAKYISSRDGKVESTYFRVQALNDSIRNNFAKGDVVRERIKHRKGEYEMQIKGYVFDFRTYLVKNEDSVVVFDFPVWVKQDFPVDKL
jgi:tRNA A37 threonylcarbamoyladenosine dehydratase